MCKMKRLARTGQPNLSRETKFSISNEDRNEKDWHPYPIGAQPAEPDPPSPLTHK